MFEQNLLAEDQKGQNQKSTQILSQTRLEVIATARLINCRLISFILIQDLDMKGAVTEFQKHLNLIKTVFFDPSEKLLTNTKNPNEQIT